jgi:hypothetical protein
MLYYNNLEITLKKLFNGLTKLHLLLFRHNIINLFIKLTN